VSDKYPQGDVLSSRGDRQGLSKKPRGKRIARKFGIAMLLVAALAGIGRLMLPWAVRDYVNRILDKNILYAGRIGPVHLHLLRGAYSIDNVRLLKTTGNIPVPFFSARRIEFSVQWDALLHRKLVGQITIDQPELNFVDAQDDSQRQTGAGAPWLATIADLFPFKINRAEIHDGTAHFRTYSGTEPVDVSLNHLEGAIDNFTNIRDETTPMVTTASATALAMNQARFEYKMTLDPFAYRPTYHVAVRLLGLDVTKTNALVRTYGGFDFKRGWFDLIVEIDAKDGQVVGYIKPLFRNLQVFDLQQDIEQGDVPRFFWQAIMGTATAVLRNTPRQQFGTLIPFRGDASGETTPDILPALGNVLRNAFIRAYLPKLQSAESGTEGIQFETPQLEIPTDGDEP
jgi:hypothetical protein